MIARYKDKISIDKLCRWADVAKSSLYYHAHPGPRGMKASAHTLIGNCGFVENSLVVDQIRAILSMDYCVYGYQKMTQELQQHIERYMHWYNFKRKHGAIGFVTPMQKWAQGFSCSTVRQSLAPGAVDLSRPDSEWALCEASALYSLEKSNEPDYLCLTGEQENDLSVAKQFRKSVQFIGG